MKKLTLVIILVITIVPLGIMFANANDSRTINNSDAKANKGEDYILEEIIIDEKKEEIVEEEDDIKSKDSSGEDEIVVSKIDGVELTQYDRQNGIDMAAILQNLNDDDDYLVFQILINNHAIDLGGVPYGELAKLINSEGEVIDKGFIWESSGGGHHISGTLKLPKNDDFNDFVNEDIDYLGLEFTGIGNSDKLSFKWDKEILDYFLKGDNK